MKFILLLTLASCALGFNRGSPGGKKMSPYAKQKLVTKEDFSMVNYDRKSNRFSCFPNGKWNGRIYTFQADNIDRAIVFFYEMDSTYDVTKYDLGKRTVLTQTRTSTPDKIKYEISFCYLKYPQYGIDGLFFSDQFLFASVRFL